MTAKNRDALDKRVVQAAQAALKAQAYVSCTDVSKQLIERAQEKRAEPKMPAEIAVDRAEGDEAQDPI
jgi:hypothetical protein